MKKYKVTLTLDERKSLQDLIAAGKAAALKLAHARILLKADAAPGARLERPPDRQGPCSHRWMAPPAVRRARIEGGRLGRYNPKSLAGG